MKSKVVVLLGLAIGLALAFSGCGEDEDEAPTVAPGETATPAAGETLTIAIPAMPLGLDKEFFSGTRPTWEAVANCNEWGMTFKDATYDDLYGTPPSGLEDALRGFTYEDYRGGEEPWFLDSWELSPDGKTSTIKIRPGITSAAGNELTAEDVKYTIERGIATEFIGAFFNSVILKLDETNPVEVVDEYTFKMNSTVPQAQLISLWTQTYWAGILDSTEVKKHATDDDPWATDWMANHCAGFGAYTVESWEPGQQVVFVKNPNYPFDTGNIDRVIYRVIPDSSVRLAAVRSGEVDIATDPTPEEWLDAYGAPGLKAIAAKANLNFFGFMNSAVEPFDDIRVRQAFNYVMPRNEISETVFGGLAAPWVCAYHCIFPGADPADWPYGDEPDFEKARELMAEAGYADGFDTELTYSSDLPQFEEAALLMKANLAEIGVDVALKPMSGTDYAAQTNSVPRQTDFGLWTDAYSQPDPIYQLNLSFEKGGFNNFASFDDPELEAKLLECDQLLTLEERVECSKPAIERSLELAGYLWLVEPYFPVIARDNIDGFKAHNLKYFMFKDLTKR